MTKKALASKLQAYFKKHMPLDPRWVVKVEYLDEIEDCAEAEAVVYRLSEYYRATIVLRNDLNTEKFIEAFRHEYLHIIYADVHMLRRVVEEINNQDPTLISTIRMLDERVVVTTEWFLDHGKGPLSMEALTLLFDGGN